MHKPFRPKPQLGDLLTMVINHVSKSWGPILQDEFWESWNVPLLPEAFKLHFPKSWVEIYPTQVSYQLLSFFGGTYHSPWN